MEKAPLLRDGEGEDRRLTPTLLFTLSRPTSLDAKVFGYLALQLYPEIPHPRFQMILTSQFPRLVAYADRCREEFFANLPDATPPSEPSPFFSNPFSAPREWFRSTFFSPRIVSASTSYAQQQEQDGEKPGKSKEERDFDLKRVYAISFGVVAMAVYVIANGLIVIGNEANEDEDGSRADGSHNDDASETHN